MISVRFFFRFCLLQCVFLHDGRGALMIPFWCKKIAPTTVFKICLVNFFHWRPGGGTWCRAFCVWEWMRFSYHDCGNVWPFRFCQNTWGNCLVLWTGLIKVSVCITVFRMCATLVSAMNTHLHQKSSIGLDSRLWEIYTVPFRLARNHFLMQTNANNWGIWHWRWWNIDKWSLCGWIDFMCGTKYQNWFTW